MNASQDGSSIISEWLRSLGLQQYSSAFYDNGYDELELCKLIKDEDLDAIGVSNSLHRKIILDSVSVLKCEGATSVYFTLEEVNRARAAANARQSTTTPTGPTRELIYDVSPRSSSQGSAFQRPTPMANQNHRNGAYAQTSFPNSPGITLPVSISDLVRRKLDMERVVITSPPYTQVSSCLWAK